MKKEKAADKKRVRDAESTKNGKKVRYSEELIVPASPPQVITKPPVSIMKNKSVDMKSESKDSVKSAKSTKVDAKAKSSSAKDTAKDDVKAKSNIKKDADSETSKSVSSSKLSVASSSSQVSVAASRGGKSGTKAPVKVSNAKNGGKISAKSQGKDSNNTEPSCNVYIGHIPDGFEEKEMRSFFKQFGDVRKVKLFRSAKTNRSRGYAFAQFKDKDVAKIVADTMNGYLIMGRQLVCNVIPQGKCHDGMYKRKYNKALIGKPRDATSNDEDD